MASPVPGKQNATQSKNLPCGGSDEMFSPTTSAAWALSTLHNFGAAAAPQASDSGSRCKTDNSLRGTRLFSKANNQSSRTDSPEYLTPQTATTTAAVNQLGVGVSAGSLREQAHQTVTWGYPPIFHHHHPHHHHINMSYGVGVGPSPPVMGRASNLPSLEYATLPNQVMPATAHPNQFSRPAPTSFVTPTPKKAKLEDDSNSSADGLDGAAATGIMSYSRKTKSLGILAENFIKKYELLPAGSKIIVDDAAQQLGVERRRIYDVVNILEAIQLVNKTEKNTYSWMGMDDLNDVFGSLQEQAILDYPDDAKVFLGCSAETQGNATSAHAKPPKKHSKTKENKSLSKLSQEFLQVFLIGYETLSLPEASDKIQGATSMEDLVAIGGGANLGSEAVDGTQEKTREKELKAAAARGLKTKIRRLYDIANVFLSVGLLRKVESPKDAQRRPNFAWNYKLSVQDIYNVHQSKMKNNALERESSSSQSNSNKEELPSGIDVKDISILSSQELRKLDASFVTPLAIPSSGTTTQPI